MSVIYDGHDLGELFVCGDPDLSILNMQPSIKDVNGRNGAVFVGSQLGTSTVEFQITAIGANVADRRNAFSTLGMWLNVDEPKRLVLPDTPDRYYLAVPDGELSLARHYDGEITKLSFTLVDPIAYGREITLTVPSGGSVAFNVSGTYAAKPTIECGGAVRSSESLLWGLLLDSSDYIYIPTGTDNSIHVKADCDERSCYVGYTVGMITLDSDWLELTPGTHTLVMTNGTGAATVTYRERWL